LFNFSNKSIDTHTHSVYITGMEFYNHKGAEKPPEEEGDFLKNLNEQELEMSITYVANRDPDTLEGIKYNFYIDTVCKFIEPYLSPNGFVDFSLFLPMSEYETKRDRFEDVIHACTQLVFEGKLRKDYTS